MARKTQALKTGMTVLRGGDVPAYTLEYLTPGKRKKEGEFETVVLSYIEIGRAGNCYIKFGDDYPTVSRKHAAIERKGDEYVLIHTSGTNPTFINGEIVTAEESLKNGDEIQFSMEGPKLRFNITASGTANMGFTRKISLVTKQAIRPYRRLAITLLIIIIIIAGIGGWLIYNQNRQLQHVRSDLEISEQNRKQDSIKAAEEFSARSKEFAGVMSKNRELASVIKEQNERMDQQSEQIQSLAEMVNAPSVGKLLYDKYRDDLYFIELLSIDAIMPDGSQRRIHKNWSGTSFLSCDGKLITTRSLIQGWRYSMDEISTWINIAELNNGEVKATFRATSSNNWFEFSYSDVVYDDSSDELITQKQVTGRGRKKQEIEILFKYATERDSDWAYINTSKVSKVNFDNTASTTLTAGDELHILSFSPDEGKLRQNDIKPTYSKVTVSQDGLSENGLIPITDHSFESNISGAPVFIKVGEQYNCIGMVPGSGKDNQRGPIIIEGILPIININEK